MDLAKLHLHWCESQHKGKTYRSYSLARSYRQDGKNRKEIVLKLGKLDDQEVCTWQKCLQYSKNPDMLLTTLKDLVVTAHYAHLDVAAANALWDEWNLDDVFCHNGKRDLSIATIARILTVNRCIDPAAKSQTPEWFRGTTLPWLLSVDPSAVNTSRIFRELATIEAHKETICEHLYAKMKLDDPDSMESVFYDLSSTTFTSSRCVLVKWGHCKEGYDNHAVLALVVNRRGLPFYWEVLPGGTADAKTIVWLLERLKDRFAVQGTTLVFDRGMVSEDNLELLEQSSIKYISAMDKNQIEEITKLDFSAFSHLELDKVDIQAAELRGFAKLNDSTYYSESRIDGNCRYILCFNPQLFKDQRKARNQALADLQIFADDLNAELLAAKKSRQYQPTYDRFKRKLTSTKLNGFVDVELQETQVTQKIRTGAERNVRTYQATVMVDDDAMLAAGRLDGFWLLVTNHTEQDETGFAVSAPNAITPYRDKVVIESSFRDIKSFVEIAPVYVWTEAHVKAHYTICVLAHLINRTVDLRLHKHKGDTTRDVVAHERFYKKLADCQLDRIEVANAGLSTYNMTRPTAEQKELLDRADLSGLLTNNISGMA